MEIDRGHGVRISGQGNMSHRSFSRDLPYSKWHATRREERHAPWKVFLPVSEDAPVLSIGMAGPCLASLGRSWGEVHVYKSTECDLEWAAEQAESLGHEYRFECLGSMGAAKPGYSVLVISAESMSVCDPGMAFRLLEPGGAVVWVGPRGHVLSISDLLKQGYCNVHRYAVLPPGKGKILVPLGNNRSTLNGLSLFAPFKWRNRFALRIGRLAACVGAQSLLGSKQVVIARKPGGLVGGRYLLDWLSSHIKHPVADASVYAGWTKLVLQLLDNQGHVIGLAKVADTPLGRRGIERESAALKRLETVSELHDFVPRSMATGEWKGHTVQIQTSTGFARRKRMLELTPAHLNFLTMLSRLDRCEMSLEKWPNWDVVWHWAHKGEFASIKEAEAARVAVERCAERLVNRNILFHRVHGDFTPWHALLGSNGLKVVDWEESEAHGIPLFDAIYFTMVQDFYSKNKTPTIEQFLSSPIDSRLKNLANSLHINPEIIILANLYSYMVLTCLQCKLEVMN